MKIIETFLNLLTTENPTEFRDQSYLRDFLSILIDYNRILEKNKGGFSRIE